MTNQSSDLRMTYSAPVGGAGEQCTLTVTLTGSRDRLDAIMEAFRSGVIGHIVFNSGLVAPPDPRLLRKPCAGCPD